MDEKIKQRLVGTIVITALLAIFLPMLFEDPVERRGLSVSEMKIPDLPVQFQSPVQVAPSSIKQVLQAPDKSLPVTHSGTNKVDSGSKNQSARVDKLVRWVIQVGSFKVKKNALAERDNLRKQGFIAFVESYNGMYRVRIGPELDKTKAEQNQKLLEKKNMKTMLIQE